MSISNSTDGSFSRLKAKHATVDLITCNRLNSDNTIEMDSLIIDSSSTSALKIRKDIAGGDVINVNTVNNIVTVYGDLQVNGTLNNVDAKELQITDVVIRIAKDNANIADSYDQGLFGEYKSSGTKYWSLYRDASDSGKFKLQKDITVLPTTVIANGTDADLQVGTLYGNVVGTITGNADTATTVTGSTQNAITSLPNLATVQGSSINSTKWGYLAALNQSLTTTSNPTFGTITASLNGNASTATYATSSGSCTGNVSGNMTLTSDQKIYFNYRDPLNVSDLNFDYYLTGDKNNINLTFRYGSVPVTGTCLGWSNYSLRLNYATIATDTLTVGQNNAYYDPTDPNAMKSYKLYIAGDTGVGGDILPLTPSIRNIGASSNYFGATYSLRLLTGNGTVSAPSVQIGAIGNGFYAPAKDWITWATASTDRLTINTSTITSTLPLAMGNNNISGVNSLTLSNIYGTSSKIDIRNQIYLNDNAIWLRDDQLHGLRYNNTGGINGLELRAYNSFTFRSGNSQQEVARLNQYAGLTLSEGKGDLCNTTYKAYVDGDAFINTGLFTSTSGGVFVAGSTDRESGIRYDGVTVTGPRIHGWNGVSLGYYESFGPPYTYTEVCRINNSSQFITKGGMSVNRNQTPNFPLHVFGDTTGSFGTNGAGQLCISGNTNTNKRLAIGYDTTNDYSIIQSIENGIGNKTLRLNPAGGETRTGGAFSMYDTYPTLSMYATVADGYTQIRMFPNNQSSNSWNLYTSGSSTPTLYCQGGLGSAYMQWNTNGWYSPSDSRLKNTITDFKDSGVDLINGLRVRNYYWNDVPNEEKKIDIGFIAQEVQSVLPNLISEFERNGQTRLGIDYNKINVYLVKAVQELSTLVNSLTQRIQALENA